MKINSRKSRDMHLCNMDTINYAIQTNFHSENKKKIKKNLRQCMNIPASYNTITIPSTIQVQK